MGGLFWSCFQLLLFEQMGFFSRIEIVIFPSRGSGRRMPCENMAISLTAADVTITVEASSALDGASGAGIATNSHGSWSGAVAVTEASGATPLRVTVHDGQPSAPYPFRVASASRLTH